MPGLDRTGPMGQGRMTGHGAGRCGAAYDSPQDQPEAGAIPRPGMGYRAGYGRNMGNMGGMDGTDGTGRMGRMGNMGGMGGMGRNRGRGMGWPGGGRGRRNRRFGWGFRACPPGSRGAKLADSFESDRMALMERAQMLGRELRDVSDRLADMDQAAPPEPERATQTEEGNE